MSKRLNLQSVTVILVRPRFPENLGSVARALKNMAIRRLVIVDGCSPLHMNAYKLASGAEDILETAEEVKTFEEAIAEMNCVVGTTAREGKGRGPLISPEDLARILVPISISNSIGLVFGPEREGLTNEELSRCHLHVKIPTSQEFSSLNLAQAVVLLCYELFKASSEFKEKPRQLADTRSFETMIEHMQNTLVDIGFLDPSHPERIVRVLRSIFGRAHLDEREVRILQGIWSRVDWYIRNRKGDGYE